MHNEDLNKINRSLQSEIIDQVNDLADDGQAAAFKEDVFTQIMIDYLLDFGALDGGEVVHFERKTGYGNVKVNGYYFDEDEGRLDIYVSALNYMDDVIALPKTEVRKFLERASRLYTMALKNYHLEMEPAHDDYSMLETISSNQSEIYKKRIVLFSNYVFDFNPDDFSIEGFSVDLWDLKRFMKNVTSIKGHESIEVDFTLFDSRVKCLAIDHFNDTYETFRAPI